MSAPLFVDTSAWWALFDRGDSNHAAAKAEYAECAEDERELVTTDYVFDELATGLRMRAGKDAAVRAGRALLDSRRVTLVRVDETDFDEAWRLFQKFDRPEISFTDAVSFAVMRRRSIGRAFAFDADFKRAGFAVAPKR